MQYAFSIILYLYQVCSTTCLMSVQPSIVTELYFASHAIVKDDVSLNTLNPFSQVDDMTSAIKCEHL